MMIALSTKALIVRTIMEDRKALTMINVVKDSRVFFTRTIFESAKTTQEKEAGNEEE